MSVEPVIGAEELRRAFVDAGTSFNTELRKRIRGYAEPVRERAEILGQGRIRNLGVPWSRMRTGAAPALVYVAPLKRGTKIPARKRPRLAALLLSRAMEPALEQNRVSIEAKIDALVARMERKFGGA